MVTINSDHYTTHRSIISMNHQKMVNSRRKQRIALVTQGGGQRGIFTAGVLDSFIKAQFDPFELYIGTSAGALNLATYIAKQHGFAQQFISQYTTDPRFFNLLKYIRRQQTMDLNWAMQQAKIGNSEIFDLDFARSHLHDREALACATNKQNLQPEYLPMFDDDWQDVLLASSAVPFLYDQTVNLRGKELIDGGVSAAIPIKEAFQRGADIVVVIRTEPVTMNQQPLTSAWIENFRLGIEQRLPSYLHRFHLDANLNSLNSFHKQLSQKLRNFYTENIWEPFKDKIPFDMLQNGGRWLFGGDAIYRLQALSGRQLSSDMIDLLLCHLQTYQKSLNFLASPPTRLQVIQLYPPKALESNALLSRPSQLMHDYAEGLDVGAAFLEHFAQPLEQISTRDKPFYKAKTNG
ncbi:MAG: patatin-like phospholipase family protein [Vibrionaceae bacterium]